jgi:hypothetical protein
VISHATVVNAAFFTGGLSIGFILGYVYGIFREPRPEGKQP